MTMDSFSESLMSCIKIIIKIHIRDLKKLSVTLFIYIIYVLFLGDISFMYCLLY